MVVKTVTRLLGIRVTEEVDETITGSGSVRESRFTDIVGGVSRKEGQNGRRLSKKCHIGLFIKLLCLE